MIHQIHTFANVQTISFKEIMFDTTPADICHIQYLQAYNLGYEPVAPVTHRTASVRVDAGVPVHVHVLQSSQAS